MENYELLCNTVAVGITNALSLSSDSPSVTIGVNASAPIISEVIKRIIKPIAERVTPRENQRIDIAAKAAITTIKNRLSNGEHFRKDVHADSASDSFQIDDILENIVKSIIDDCEKLKSEIYGRFLGNIFFHEEWNAVFMHNIAQCVKNVSYTDLCILYVFSKSNYENISGITKIFNNHSESYVTDVYIAIKKLLSLGLLMRIPPFNMSKGDIDHLTVSPFGFSLTEAVSLELLPDSHVQPYEAFLSHFR